MNQTPIFLRVRLTSRETLMYSQYSLNSSTMPTRWLRVRKAELKNISLWDLADLPNGATNSPEIDKFHVSSPHSIIRKNIPTPKNTAKLLPFTIRELNTVP